MGLHSTVPTASLKLALTLLWFAEMAGGEGAAGGRAGRLRRAGAAARAARALRRLPHAAAQLLQRRRRHEGRSRAPQRHDFRNACNPR